MSRELPRYRDFQQIQKHLESRCNVQVYDIGGTYLQGYIDGIFTRDIDIVIVFTSSIANIVYELDASLEELSYKRTSRPPSNPLRYETRLGMILDVFIEEVFMIKLTPSMLSRVEKKKLCPEDVFLLKAQSTRGLDEDIKDLEDLISIVCDGKFDYHIVIKELECQLETHIELNPQNNNRLLAIIEKVEKLNEKFSVEIPILFINEIERIFVINGILR